MSKKEHIKQEIEALHNKDKTPGHGCIWRHEGGYGSYRSTECHYRKSGFQAGSGREGMYNKDHRSKAESLGYATWDHSDKKAENRFEADLTAAEGGRTGSALAKFRSKFRDKFNSSLRWLQYDPQGWHYGFRDSEHDVHGKVEVTFKPKDQDTYAHGAWYPYHHEYHHLIAVDALRKHVVTETDQVDRIKALLATHWNINKGKNVLCLPTEVWVAAIVELPAHCPWDTMDHPEYSESLKDRLNTVKVRLDDAMKGKESCKDQTAKISEMLDKVAERLLRAIKRQAGGTLGALPKGGGK